MKLRDLFWFLEIKVGMNEHGARFGAERSTILFRSSRYMTRWILWFKCCLRIHKFWRGDDDDDRAPHDHPSDFWTFPLVSYTEKFWDSTNRIFRVQVVQRFRWHYRPAEYRHIVIGRADGKPIWTIVFMGRWRRKWGFWPDPDTFVYWREWVKDNQ